MRRIIEEEVRSWLTESKNPDGLSAAQMRLKLEKAAALDALRNSSSLAHLKPILEWMIGLLVGLAMRSE